MTRMYKNRRVLRLLADGSQIGRATVELTAFGVSLFSKRTYLQRSQLVFRNMYEGPNLHLTTLALMINMTGTRQASTDPALIC